MPARYRGFTLIELLVVLLLIGIVVSFAVLSVGDGGDREVETETRRLAALLGLASEEALLQSVELGVRFEAGGYTFFGLGSEGWTPLADELLRTRQLPDGITLQLLLEGLPVAFEKSDTVAEPHVFLFSSGERVPPFEVRLTTDSEGRGWQLLAPLIGPYTVSRIER